MSRWVVGDQPMQFGATRTTALMMGGGLSTSASTALTKSTADVSWMKFYTRSTATTGDTRGIYWKHWFSGAGGSGEVARFYGAVNAAAATGGTVNGVHTSLYLETGGSVSGAGNAIRATLGLAASVTGTGTLSALQVDSDLASGATVPAVTAFIRATDSGTGTIGKLFNLPTIASAGILAAHITDELTHSIRCIDAAGTVFYIMCTTTASNRTGGA